MNNTNLTIATTGLSGLVGTRIYELLHNSFNFNSISQDQMDITDIQSVNNNVTTLDFDIFLHLAAFTDVDGAEKNPELAKSINVTGTKNIYEAVQKKQKKFIYISTDFVFDGETGPYDESSITNPQSVYGRTKYEGEKLLGNDALIVRISYPYRAAFEEKTDFVRSIIRSLQNNTPLLGVTDQLLTLTFIDDIAHGLAHLFNNYSTGIIHLVGGDCLSAYDSMKLIAQTFSLDKSLIGKTTFDEFYKNRAKRPRIGNITSIKNNFYKMKTFEEGLLKIKKQLLIINS